MRKWARSEKTQSTKGRLNKHNWWLLIVLPVWTYAAFWMAQLIVLGLVWVFSHVGVPLGSVNEVLLNATGSVVVYVLAVTLVVGLPFYIRRRRTTLKEMGVTDWPSWWDVVITPAAFIVYTICSAVFLTVVTKLIAIDIHQPQAAFFDRHRRAFFMLTMALATLMSIVMFDAKVSLSGDDCDYILAADAFWHYFTFPGYYGSLYPIVLSPFVGLFGY